MERFIPISITARLLPLGVSRSRCPRRSLLEPSSAHMWMACPPSVRLRKGIKDEGGEYAKEGILVHRIGELLLRKRWEGDSGNRLSAYFTRVIFR